VVKSCSPGKNGDGGVAFAKVGVAARAAVAANAAVSWRLVVVIWLSLLLAGCG
jgi:hypothetical protein